MPESLSSMFDGAPPATGATYRYIDGQWIDLGEPSTET